MEHTDHRSGAHQVVQPPSLGRLYVRAALRAAVSRLSSNGTLGTLPEETVVVEHPGVKWEQAERHRRLFGGEVFDGVHRRSLPSVLIHTMGFPVQMALMAREDFPLPLMGLVHLSNEVDHLHRIEPEQPVRISVHADRLRPHRRGTQVEIVTEVRPAGTGSAGGRAEVLWRGVSAYLGRGVHLARDSGDGELSDDPSAEAAAGELGQRDDSFSLPRKTGEWHLSAGAGREYARLSGDYNPIHLSGLTAKALGMPSAIVHGMYSAARMLEGREPEEAGHRWSISFEAPVRLPGRVSFGVEHRDARRQILTGWNARKRRPHFRGVLRLP